MATPTAIRTAADDKLAQLWATIQNREDSYAAAHNGRYWQGIRTHSIDPADGAAELPDVGNRTPTDQPTPWPAALTNSALPMSLQIDVYDGPQGTGYSATLRVTINGQTWQRVAQVGPETWRAQGWRLIPAVAL